jgi:nucleoside-triphosphatase THEP1
MRCAVILHAPIGGGKTRTAEAAAERARADGIRVMGILSRRVLEGAPDASYDILELDTGERVPLVKSNKLNLGEGWESYGNPRYLFSLDGFRRANIALCRAAEEMRDGVVTFVDEYGKLESEHLGIHPGAVTVADAIMSGGVAVYLCRDERVAEVTDLVKGKAARIFTMEAGDADALLRIILGCTRL